MDILLKKYNDNYMKFYAFKRENSSVYIPDEKRVKKQKNNYVHSEKLLHSLSRSKSKIFDYAMSNVWDYFVTITFDSKKVNDRTNLKELYKKLSKFINNLNSNYHCSIKYLLVPELHSDCQSWHFHGLIADLPKKLINNNSHGYLHIYKIFEKFGFNSLRKINYSDSDSAEKIAKYITKYITKDLVSSVREVGQHIYYCSNNLRTPQRLHGKLNYNLEYLLNWFLGQLHTYDYMVYKSVARCVFENDYFNLFCFKDKNIIKNFFDSDLFMQHKVVNGSAGYFPTY